MKKWFQPNLSAGGRLVRGVCGLALLALGGLLVATDPVPAVVLMAMAAFVLFEALRGWCVLRACELKTRF